MATKSVWPLTSRAEPMNRPFRIFFFIKKCSLMSLIFLVHLFLVYLYIYIYILYCDCCDIKMSDIIDIKIAFASDSFFQFICIFKNRSKIMNFFVISLLRYFLNIFISFFRKIFYFIFLFFLLYEFFEIHSS